MTAPLPTRFPSINGLRAVEATARLKSFERAATELNLTPSAISKRVVTLEQHIGVSLFTRGANSLSLTPAGERYVEHTRQVLRMLATMYRDALASEEAQLRVSAPPTFARQLIVPHLPSFTDSNPHIQLNLEIIAPEPNAPLTGADVEIRFGSTELHGPAMLMQDVMTPMASPTYLAQHKINPSRPEDLQNLALLNMAQDEWTSWFKTANIDFSQPLSGPKLADLGMTYEAAARGQGVALCRPSLLGEWLSRDALVPLFDIYGVPAGGYYLLTNSNQEAALSFCAWLKNLCGSAAKQNLETIRKYFAQRESTTS